MNGKDLYAIYSRKYLQQNIEIDQWDELDQVDRNVWNQFAEELLEG